MIYTDDIYRQKAREKYGSEGEIEIDDNAVISRGDDKGAYVQAWVWVYADADEECAECEGPLAEGDDELCAACAATAATADAELIAAMEEL